MHTVSTCLQPCAPYVSFATCVDVDGDVCWQVACSMQCRLCCGFVVAAAAYHLCMQCSLPDTTLAAATAAAISQSVGVPTQCVSGQVGGGPTICVVACLLSCLHVSFACVRGCSHLCEWAFKAALHPVQLSIPGVFGGCVQKHVCDVCHICGGVEGREAGSGWMSALLLAHSVGERA